MKKKVALRVSIEKQDLDNLKQKADKLGLSVPTYSRIILKQKGDE